MEAVASYVLRLVCGSIVCSLILTLTGVSGVVGRMIRLLCGIFLSFLALSPLAELDLGNLRYVDPGIALEARDLAECGTVQAKEAMAVIIKEQCVTYILNKADELSLELTAEVELEAETGIPVSAVLHGSPTPYAKQILSDYITQTLGIERSRILWNP